MSTPSSRQVLPLTARTLVGTGLVVMIGFVALHLKVEQTITREAIPMKIVDETSLHSDGDGGSLSFIYQGWTFSRNPPKTIPGKSSYVSVYPLASRDVYNATTNFLSDEALRYPTDVLNASLRVVYVVERLKRIRDTELHGERQIELGGTYEKNSIFISVGSVDQRKDAQTVLAQIFHHELSSLLLKEFASEDLFKRWMAVSGHSSYDHRYDYRRTHSEEESRRLREEGFLEPYSKVSIENDFNCLAMHMMSPFPDGRSLAIILNYPKITKKAFLLWQFYRSLRIRPSNDISDLLELHRHYGTDFDRATEKADPFF